MTTRIILFFFALLPLILQGQSPYQVDWKKEAFYLGPGLALMAGGFLSKAPPLLSVEEISTLNASSINRFDRQAVFNYSTQAETGSDLLLYSSIAAPFLFLSGQKSRNEFGKIALLYGESLLATEGITLLTKKATRRIRPFVYNPDIDLAKKNNAKAQYSFFSGHTSTASLNFFFAAKVFADYFPDSKFKPVVWGTAIIAPALTGYFRVKAGKHFPTDVITGYAVGALIGYMVPQLHRSKMSKTIRILPGSNNLTLIWTMN